MRWGETNTRSYHIATFCSHEALTNRASFCHFHQISELVFASKAQPRNLGLTIGFLLLRVRFSQRSRSTHGLKSVQNRVLTNECFLRAFPQNWNKTYASAEGTSEVIWDIYYVCQESWSLSPALFHKTRAQAVYQKHTGCIHSGTGLFLRTFPSNSYKLCVSAEGASERTSGICYTLTKILVVLKHPSRSATR